MAPIVVTGLSYDTFLFYKQTLKRASREFRKGLSSTIRNGCHPKSVGKHILTLQVQMALQCPRHFLSSSLILGQFERDPWSPHKRGSIYKQGFVLSYVKSHKATIKNVQQAFEVEPKLIRVSQKVSKLGGVDSNT